MMLTSETIRRLTRLFQQLEEFCLTPLVKFVELMLQQPEEQVLKTRLERSALLKPDVVGKLIYLCDFVKFLYFSCV
ncbi:Hypothetical protein NTJ_00169 [Nesidiocoris tenuis]|uniref:Uncharacterized protein n=1 Tax=Nesidiocoris tenuis TaxID=355587 RepID=A0ABN7A7Z8_9HEMI|nr:Hypothetical protein NTJ_00169 [Nesidiocoris tenuis]